MLFNQLLFLVFLAAVFALHWAFPRGRLAILALANAAFYLAAGPTNLALFLGASLATYLLGRHVTGAHGRWVLAAGVALNVANLAYFKYAGFVAANLYPLFGFGFLDPVRFQAFLLPIGISFYTFQHISYLVDRRTKDLPEAPGYLHFWVYIAFFGHSVAGPIMRGHEFFPQIAETPTRKLDAGMVQLGLALLLLGLLKKGVVADELAKLVDPAFADVGALTAATAWVAAALFSFQIYFDFSAYSDMAVGIGLLFGYTLRQNFRTPYVSANASEFWRRWHVTLSEWIRDYVYIPLGGNRGGAARASANLFLAMLVSGLWHGASWTFVLWGAWHGLLLVGQRLWARAKEGLGWGLFGTGAYHAVAVAAFFGLTVWGWVLFRAASLEDAAWMFAKMADVGAWGGFAGQGKMLALIAGLWLLHALEHRVRGEDEAWTSWARRLPIPVRGLALGFGVLAYMVTYGDLQEFIYFRF